MYTTNAEAARQTGMCLIYNAAWRDAKNGKPLTDSEMAGNGARRADMTAQTGMLADLPDYLEDKPEFDWKA